MSPDIVSDDYDKDRQLTQIGWAESGMGLDFFPAFGRPDQLKKIGTSTVLVDHGYAGTSGKLPSIVAGAMTTSYAYTSSAQTNWWGGLLFRRGRRSRALRGTSATPTATTTMA